MYTNRSVAAAHGLRAVVVLMVCMGILIAVLATGDIPKETIPDMLLICLVAFAVGYGTRDTES